MPEQEETLPPLSASPLTSAPEGAITGAVAPRKASRARLWLSWLWRYRVLVFGTLALMLALAGEWLMRLARGQQPEGAPPWALVGSVLVALAAVAVLPVAWLRDRLPSRTRKVLPSVARAAPDTPPFGYPVAEASMREPEPEAMRVLPTRRAVRKRDPLRAAMERMTAGAARLRARVGALGTIGGLAVTMALGASLALLIRADYTSPLAPWLWLVALGALVLTFVGVRPAATLAAMPHDPHEPAAEPRVTRAEWIALGVIVAGAVLLRFVNLEGIPAGPYTDEAGRALVARDINIGGKNIEGIPFSLFGTAWWGVPNLYFWLEGQSLRLFGDNLLGARVMHALAGVGTVWYTYRLGRLAWSPRAGLIAAALVTASDFAIQFSRTAGESTILIFTWVVCFYYLYKGIKTQRPLDFVWSGIAGGLCLYSYASGKLLPPFLALFAVYLLARWGWRGVRRFAPLLALTALAAGVVFLPNAVFLVAVKPDALTQRSLGVAIWSEHNRSNLEAQYGTTNWGEIVARQYALTYSAFDVGEERGPFYPTREPLLPVPWAALWVLGTAYVVWRLGDVRYAGLAVWLMAALAGAALTNDTPTMQRAAGVVPLLGLLPALFADRVLSALAPAGTERAVARGRGSGWAALRIVAPNVLAAVAVGLLGWQTLSFYFGTYAPRNLYLDYALAGKYIEKLDPGRDVVYTYNIPTWLGDPSPIIFLGKDVPRYDFNPGQDLPMTANPGETVHIIAHPGDSPVLDMLKSYYPSGALTVITGTEGTPYLGIFRLEEKILSEKQYSLARYGPGATGGGTAGAELRRTEPKIGTLGDSEEATRAFAPPSWLSYPARAEWETEVIAPQFGRYVLSLEAPGGADLQVDGQPIVSVPPGEAAPVQEEIVLAKGTHTFRLAGTLENREAQIALRWGTVGDRFPVGRRFLWNGQEGSLVARAFLSSAESWFLDAQGAPNNAFAVMARRDGALAISNVNEVLQGGPTVFAVWEGVFGAQQDGIYLFDPRGEAYMSLWIDGRLVGGRDIPAIQGAFPVPVALTRGPHRFELRYGARQGNASLLVLWQTPGKGELELMTASLFAPAAGGAWPLSEMPAAPVLDAALTAP